MAVVAHLATSDPAADLSGAVNLLDVMERSSLTGYEFLVLDARFHRALAEACGNEVMAATMAGWAMRSSVISSSTIVSTFAGRDVEALGVRAPRHCRGG